MDRGSDSPGKAAEYCSVSAATMLNRDVYCIQGLPVDAVTMPDVTGLIRASAESRTRFFLSTPNLNFLVGAQNDAAYRETVIASDLNIADGMPLIWIARLLGLPIRHRIAGSDLLTALSASAPKGAAPLKIMFFGGVEGAGEAACRAINTGTDGLVCTGHVNPGFKSAEDLGESEIIDAVNAVDADFLIVALGARKGQVWLHQNEDRLRAPVRSHLGALINMTAGTIVRAPAWMQRAGLEWLWRIRQEPALWRRYRNDAIALACLLSTRILPLFVLRWVHAFRRSANPLKAEIMRDQDASILVLEGLATAENRDVVRRAFLDLAGKSDVILDMRQMSGADPGFFGLLLIFRHLMISHGRSLEFRSVPPRMKRCFRLNGVQFVLD